MLFAACLSVYSIRRGKRMLRSPMFVLLGLSLATAAVGAQLPAATAPAPGAMAIAGQQSDAAKAQELARSRQLDVILAAEVPLGSDVWRAQKLDQSPRHHEVATIPGGSRNLQAFVVHPDTRGKVPVVVMVPEDQGINNWARDIADQIAAMGYLVIVPDVLAGYGPNGGGRSSFPDTRSAMMVLGTLTSNEAGLTADMNAWADYGKKLAESNGKLAVVGFAWGAGRAFWFATQRKDLNAAFIFYDWSPPASALAGITAPVYGFYAENDARVTKSLDATKAAMAAAGKRYEMVMYPGSDHMFVRLGEEPGNINPANIDARALSMARLQQLLKGI
jgi:carboxymethylenebutenolidase